MNQTAVIGMSGGVDSAVAALLLKEQGFSVIGVTMRLLCGKLSASASHADRDAADAAAVCARLGIPHRAPDFSAAFEAQVVDRFAAEYAAGRTPNPCVLCNRAVKFGVLWEYARALGADCLTTGHYASVRQDPETGRFQLLADESAKDQSYVLYGLTQEQLAHIRFPLSGKTKEEVRRLAEAHALPIAHKSDSMDICFVPDGDHSAFLRRYTGREMPPGEFADTSGRVLGTHRGLDRYTVGQRKGLGLSAGKPLYVLRLDAAQNRVIVGGEDEQYTASLTASDSNFVSIAPPTAPIRVTARVRYHAAPAEALLTPLENNRFRLDFDRPQRAVAPGQAVVLYDGRLLLGGGTID